MAEPTLTSAEAAARLGVKRETLYAYVSRGVLTRTLSLDGRTSLFDPDEIDRMRSARRRGAEGELGTVISSSITRVDDKGHSYRDIPVADLVDRRFEAVADLLWERTGPWTLSAKVLANVRAAQATLPPEVPMLDRMRLAVSVVSALDPLRHDQCVDAVCQAARSMLIAMVDGLPLANAQSPGSQELDDQNQQSGSLTDRLWNRLSPVDATKNQKACLNTAFVLLADHGLAASTFAARIAASVRADPYSIALTGLGTIGGTLHGAASAESHRFIQRAADTSPEEAVGQILSAGLRVPGVGHLVYKEVDPRQVILMQRLTAAWEGDPRLATVVELHKLVGERVAAPINVDFALGSLTWLAGMNPSVGEGIFVARTAGWVAHGIEEFGERPVRFRPTARYTGPAPVGVPEMQRQT